jgi:hypothetical protein
MSVLLSVPFDTTYPGPHKIAISTQSCPNAVAFVPTAIIARSFINKLDTNPYCADISIYSQNGPENTAIASTHININQFQYHNSISIANLSVYNSISPNSVLQLQSDTCYQNNNFNGYVELIGYGVLNPGNVTP